MLQFLVLGLVPGTKIQITFIDVLLVLFAVLLVASVYLERNKLAQLLRSGKSNDGQGKVQSA